MGSIVHSTKGLQLVKTLPQLLISGFLERFIANITDSIVMYHEKMTIIFKQQLQCNGQMAIRSVSVKLGQFVCIQAHPDANNLVTFQNYRQFLV